MPRRKKPTRGNVAYAAEKIPVAARAVLDVHTAALRGIEILAEQEEATWRDAMSAVNELRLAREQMAKAETTLIAHAVLAGAPMALTAHLARVSDSTLERQLRDTAADYLGRHIERDAYGRWQVMEK
jgi:hypothetical protein